ncbi:methyl-accepting chemotaxis protein [Rossellomorea aquimaris]|uniref:methyl-accepting chemotaxis protein n=1 Tax=Rossellomorea aquimaris TaxID=189382 RepID=UPI001CD262C6|nr:methyl-accepting chemotaxis protein [Rossellomorea aquimaris]MCA1054836.1 methyl-accepting chemotaxis protein [Rossellomorea aquimaris]
MKSLFKQRTIRFHKALGRLLNSLTIKKKLAYTFLCSSILFLISIGLAVFSTNSILQDMHLIKKSGDRSIQVTEIGRLINAKDIRIADYITFLNEEDLSQYRKLRNELNKKMNDAMDSSGKGEQKKLKEVLQNNKRIDDLFIKEVAPAVVRLDEEIYTESRKKISELRNENNKILTEIRNNTVKDQAQVMQQSENAVLTYLIWLIVTAAAAALISAILVHLVAKNIKDRIQSILNVTNAVARGELATSVLPEDRKDELGQLSSSVGDMVSSLRDLVEGINKGANSVNEGSRGMKDLANMVKQSSLQLNDYMSQLSESSETQAASTLQLSTSNETFDSQLYNVDKKSKNLSHTSEQVRLKTISGYQSMEETKDQLERMFGTIKNTYTMMDKMEENVEQISQLTQTIKNIAVQTNLLSLNASIEASRAGDAGKGFAVVANEVRKLAGNVQQSLTEINAVVQNVQASTGQVSTSLKKGYVELQSGKELIYSSAENFNHIKQQVEEMAGFISDISNSIDLLNEGKAQMSGAFQAVSTLGEELNGGTIMISSSVQEQHVMVENMFMNSDNLLNEADELSNLVKKFKTS